VACKNKAKVRQKERVELQNYKSLPGRRKIVNRTIKRHNVERFTLTGVAKIQRVSKISLQISEEWDCAEPGFSSEGNRK